MQLSDKQKEPDETIRVLRGESRMDIDLLNGLVADAKAAVEQLAAAVENARQACTASQCAGQKEYEKLQSWADLCERCSFEAFKALGVRCEGRGNEKAVIYVTA